MCIQFANTGSGPYPVCLWDLCHLRIQLPLESVVTCVPQLHCRCLQILMSATVSVSHPAIVAVLTSLACPIGLPQNCMRFISAIAGLIVHPRQPVLQYIHMKTVQRTGIGKGLPVPMPLCEPRCSIHFRTAQKHKKGEQRMDNTLDRQHPYKIV